MKQTLRALCVLGLAPMVGVSCGDPSLSAGIEGPSTASTPSEHDYYFAPIKTVVLSDRGPRCATVWVGGVIELQACADVQHRPQLMYAEAARGLFVLMIDRGDVISFPDHSVRILETSQNYVVAQLSAEMSTAWLKLIVTSATGVRRCVIDRITRTHCR